MEELYLPDFHLVSLRPRPFTAVKTIKHIFIKYKCEVIKRVVCSKYTKEATCTGLLERLAAPKKVAGQ